MVLKFFSSLRPATYFWGKIREDIVQFEFLMQLLHDTIEHLECITGHKDENKNVDLVIT